METNAPKKIENSAFYPQKLNYNPAAHVAVKKHCNNYEPQRKD